MDVIILPLLSVLHMALGLLWWAILIYIVMTWLEQFGIINRYNPAVYNVMTFLFRVVEPMLGSIRRFVPNFGSIDISPLILILIIYFLQGVIQTLGRKFV